MLQNHIMKTQQNATGSLKDLLKINQLILLTKKLFEKRNKMQHFVATT